MYMLPPSNKRRRALANETAVRTGKRDRAQRDPVRAPWRRVCVPSLQRRRRARGGVCAAAIERDGDAHWPVSSSAAALCAHVGVESAHRRCSSVGERAAASVQPQTNTRRCALVNALERSVTLSEHLGAESARRLCSGAGPPANAWRFALASAHYVLTTDILGLAIGAESAPRRCCNNTQHLRRAFGTTTQLAYSQMRRQRHARCHQSNLPQVECVSVAKRSKSIKNRNSFFSVHLI